MDNKKDGFIADVSVFKGSQEDLLKHIAQEQRKAQLHHGAKWSEKSGLPAEASFEEHLEAIQAKKQPVQAEVNAGAGSEADLAGNDIVFHSGYLVP